ncbi:HAD family hydrolase [Pseudonocardia sp.]|uniref:HAD family hydrolase n=1 Tax=Pseudonocardia sp. TaxID=60912 RepID=UPI0031FCED08
MRWAGRCGRRRRAASRGARAFAALPGVGIRAVVDGGGRRRQACAARRAGSGGAGPRPRREPRGRRQDGHPAGVLAVADTVRQEARGAVAALAALTGRPPVLLTGDAPAPAAVVAAALGIADVRAGLLPVDKDAAVAEWQRADCTVLAVGDGINDAPLLATVDAGLAVGVFTRCSGLAPLAAQRQNGRRTIRRPPTAARASASRQRAANWHRQRPHGSRAGGCSWCVVLGKKAPVTVGEAFGCLPCRLMLVTGLY